MIRGSVTIFATRILQVGSGALIAVLLARALGIDGYGDYTLMLTLMLVVVIPVQFGISRLLVRDTKRLADEPEELMGFLRWAALLSVLWSLVGIGLIAVAAGALSQKDDRALMALLPIAVATMFAINASFFLSGVLAGKFRTELEQSVQNILRPAIFLAFLAALNLALGSLTAGIAFAAYLASVSVALVFLWRAVISEVNILPPAPIAQERRAAWLKSASYFMMIGGVDVVLQSTDILMLGAMATSADVGIYRIGAILAALLSLPLSAATTHAAPRIAAAAADGAAFAAIQNQSIRLAKLCCAATVVLLLGAWFFAQPVIAFAFGAGFEGSHLILLVLGAGSVFNVAMGLNRAFLSMRGQEAVVFRVMCVTAALNLVLNYLFISWSGTVGAAAATAISTMFWNVWLHVETHRRLGCGVAAFSSAMQSAPSASQR
ncbi:MAG: oligosaccharide flippase family protein [Pseudomonadota bacterium]